MILPMVVAGNCPDWHHDKFYTRNSYQQAFFFATIRIMTMKLSNSCLHIATIVDTCFETLTLWQNSRLCSELEDSDKL